MITVKYMQNPLESRGKTADNNYYVKLEKEEGAGRGRNRPAVYHRVPALPAQFFIKSAGSENFGNKVSNIFSIPRQVDKNMPCLNFVMTFDDLFESGEIFNLRDFYVK